jgi:predicted metal-dependent peptidase
MMNAVIKPIDAETKLKKAHIRLMRHPETCLYSGVILLGDTKIVDGEDNVPTACTDGINTYYGRDFVDELSVEELAAVVLHENLHKLLKQIPRHKDLSKKSHLVTNMAMDYVVNDIIHNLKDKSLCHLPDGCLYDPMFHDWSVRQVFDYLWQEMDGAPPPDDPQGEGGDSNDGQGNGGGSGKLSKRGKPLDQHDYEGKKGKDGKGGGELNPEEMRELERKLNEALQQGGMLAGKMGADIPRAIKDAMEPEIRWDEVLNDFWASSMRGCDEYTWAKLNRRRLGDDLYLPSAYSDTLGEAVVCIDTSCSIDQKQIDRVASRVADLCELYPPDRVRVLWWDTRVHGEQIFEPSQYSQITQLMKPLGGGGTHVSCVSEYINERGIKADCVIVFTDGYVEHDVKWEINAPTLWLVTAARGFTPPVGQKVMVKQ